MRLKPLAHAIARAVSVSAAGTIPTIAGAGRAQRLGAGAETARRCRRRSKFNPGCEHCGIGKAARIRDQARIDPTSLGWMLSAVVLAVVLIACGCGRPDRSGEAAEHKPANAEGVVEAASLRLSAEEAARAGLEVETLAPRAFADSITVTATIRPNQDRIARVAPRIEGRILQVMAGLGAQVRSGQSLAVLDSLAIGEAQAALLLAQSNQRVAKADFKRAEALIAHEIISRREFLHSRADLEKSSAELRAARDRLRLLGGSAEVGGAANSTFPVVAPLTGTVIQKKATVGELGTPGDPLFTVADLSTVWIEANLTEDVLARVKVGTVATVTVTAYPGERFTGRVTYIASLLDKESRTVPARIEVQNEDGRLKPEMYATATIQTAGAGMAATREVLSVPDAAILLLHGQQTIFVQERGGYEPRAIEPGDKLSGRTVIKSGVEAGDKVVTAGAYALKARLLRSQIGDEH